MTVAEPALQTAPGKTGHYRGRWRWWYSSIADYRLANPGCTNREVAAHLSKAENTISAIVSTDLYREYEAQRRQAWRERNENILREKLTGVTIRALDAAEARLKKQQDQIPLGVAKELIEVGLDRLGFGPTQGPSVVVNSGVHVNAPDGAVSLTLLSEARGLLRSVEQQKLSPALKAIPVPEDLDSVLDLKADEVGADALPGASSEVDRIASEIEQEILNEIAPEQRRGGDDGGGASSEHEVESSKASNGGEAE